MSEARRRQARRNPRLGTCCGASRHLFQPANIGSRVVELGRTEINNDGQTTSSANAQPPLRRSVMALTRDFRETVAARAARDPAFKAALLQEALQAFVEGGVAEGLVLLRDGINASIWFSALSKETHIPEKSP